MKIGLMTPYTGGNLGDAAIQEAVIRNIRQRLPKAEIFLITLCPLFTSKLHSVSSFPIGMITFSPGPLIEYKYDNVANAATTVRYGLLSRAKAVIKRSSLLYFALKFVYQMLTIGAAKSGFKELVHIGRAYKLMKGVNLLIVSGGGQLDDYWGGPWRHPYALFKWGLISKAVGAKYVFLSVGKCSLESRISSFLIRHALKFAAYRSYRDLTSKRLLENIVFTRNDAIYPDLAFSYVHPGLQRKLNRSNIGKVVGVSPIAYLSRYGWPKKNLSIYQRYLQTLVCFISDLVGRGYSIVLFSTDPADRKVIDEFVDRLSKDFNLDMNGRICQPRTDTLDELFNQLVDVDYVVASRLHGVLLPQLLCIPVLAISYDQKVDTHMVDMWLPEYCLDIHNIETSSLIESFQSLAVNSDLIKARLKQKIEDNACALKHQFDFVLGQKE